MGTGGSEGALIVADIIGYIGVALDIAFVVMIEAFTACEGSSTLTTCIVNNSGESGKDDFCSEEFDACPASDYGSEGTQLDECLCKTSLQNANVTAYVTVAVYTIAVIVALIGFCCKLGIRAWTWGGRVMRVITNIFTVFFFIIKMLRLNCYEHCKSDVPSVFNLGIGQFAMDCIEMALDILALLLVCCPCR